MYKIAICDDLEADRNYISGMVQKWSRLADADISISTFTSAENFLFEYADNQDFDILLLDVEMGEMDGVTLAKKLRKENEVVQIIFITGYTDYIEEGYEVSALHYLVKPVREEKLFDVLTRAAGKIEKDDNYINLQTGSELYRVPVYTIKYISVQGNYVTVHANTEVTVKMTLGDIGKMLDERFYKIGRSCIVNLTKITKVTKTDVFLTDKTSIPLPRGAYEGINRAIINQ